MMQRLWYLLPCAVLALAACGQKGPLYLPPRSTGVVVTRPAAAGSAPTGGATAHPEAGPGAHSSHSSSSSSSPSAH